MRKLWINVARVDPNSKKGKKALCGSKWLHSEMENEEEPVEEIS